MKRAIYFDIQFGASGDMLLGSLLDIGADIYLLRDSLAGLNLNNWEISPETLVKNGFSGTSANVKCRDEKHARRLDDIKKIINQSGLSERARGRILDIFQNLALAESEVHGVDINEIHFHEVGALDAIIDISSFCVCMEILEIEDIFFGDFYFGSGSVNSLHGILPVPVPAVVELTRNYRSQLTGRTGENITPTAAAILTTLGKQISFPFSYTLVKKGIGFGTRESASPNFTRAFLIETEKNTEEIVQLESNIDDMNPQVYPEVIEKILDAGALDAYFSQISMKKGRTGSLLTVLVPAETAEAIKELIYRNTTTIGIRSLRVAREKLRRDFASVELFGHKIRIKTAYLNNEIVNIQAEFEDCRTLSREKNIPLKEVMARATGKYLESRGKR